MAFLITALSIAGTSSGIVYCLISLWCTIQFHARRRHTGTTSNFTPPVSILKPLCGPDPHAYESLRSHCVQDYSDYEIIFGVRTADDPAVNVVQRLMREFPDLPMRLVMCPNVLGTNLKISNILQMLPAARHPYLLINDSDICVPRDYLSLVIEPLHDRSVGLVTCLYRGLAAPDIGSRLESIAIEADFVPGVLVARRFDGGLRFAMGSTMAFHRDILERIGGLVSIADYLADDYELGLRVSRSGLRVEIADCLVDHYLPPYSWSEFVQHQVRWARTVRNCRPRGYSGMIATFLLPWSILALISAPSFKIGWLFLLIALALRLTVMISSGFVVLRDRQVFRNLWLLPLRDIVTPIIWFLAYTANTIVWRGNTFEVTHGKLRKL